MLDPIGGIRVFLDTNVIISATRLDSSRLLNLWQLANVTLLTSPYVIKETLDHVQGPALPRFETLLKQMERVNDPDSANLPVGIVVVEKDRPILAAALSARADFLLTGDKNHFGHLYRVNLSGTLILPPGTFLEREVSRLIRPALR